MQDLLEKYDLYGMIGEGCKPPDHSIVELKVQTLCYNDTNQVGETIQRESSGVQSKKRYRFDNISENFLNSDRWHVVLDHLLDKINLMSKQQACVDSVYKEMLSEFFKEMDFYIDFSLNTKKKFVKSSNTLNHIGMKSWHSYGKICQLKKKVGITIKILRLKFY